MTVPGTDSSGARQPLVSIGIPTHERATTLARALDSALAQTYERIEVIIADNGSQDLTEAVCREASARDKRVRYLRRKHNVGPTANFNELLSPARATTCSCSQTMTGLIGITWLLAFLRSVATTTPRSSPAWHVMCARV